MSMADILPLASKESETTGIPSNQVGLVSTSEMTTILEQSYESCLREASISLLCALTGFRFASCKEILHNVALVGLIWLEKCSSPSAELLSHLIAAESHGVVSLTTIRRLTDLLRNGSMPLKYKSIVQESCLSESFRESLLRLKPDDILPGDELTAFIRDLLSPDQIEQWVEECLRWILHARDFYVRLKALRQLTVLFPRLPSFVTKGKENSLILKHLCHSLGLALYKTLEKGLLEWEFSKPDEKESNKINLDFKGGNGELLLLFAQQVLVTFQLILDVLKVRRGDTLEFANLYVHCEIFWISLSCMNCHVSPIFPLAIEVFKKCLENPSFLEFLRRLGTKDPAALPEGVSLDFAAKVQSVGASWNPVFQGVTSLLVESSLSNFYDVLAPVMWVQQQSWRMAQCPLLGLNNSWCLDNILFVLPWAHQCLVEDPSNEKNTIKQSVALNPISFFSELVRIMDTGSDLKGLIDGIRLCSQSSNSAQASGCLGVVCEELCSIFFPLFIDRAVRFLHNLFLQGPASLRPSVLYITALFLRSENGYKYIFEFQPLIRLACVSTSFQTTKKSALAVIEACMECIKQAPELGEIKDELMTIPPPPKSPSIARFTSRFDKTSSFAENPDLRRAYSSLQTAAECLLRTLQHPAFTLPEGEA
jgi:hypothetical protein